MTAVPYAAFAKYALAGAFTKAQAIQPDSDAIPLTLRPNAAQTAANAILKLDNTADRPTPHILMQGAQRSPPGNTTPYTTQIGGMGGSNPGIVTNAYVSIAGRQDAGANGFAGAPAVGGEAAYMLGISSDVGAAPAFVVQGGNNAAPLVRGYTYAGAKVLDILETGQLQLPVQGVAGGLLLGGDALLYRSAADTLSTDDHFIAGSACNVQADFFTDRANTQTYITTNSDGTHTWQVVNRQSGKTPFSIKMHASQSVNAFEVVDSGGAVKVRVTSAGALVAEGNGSGTDAFISPNNRRNAFGGSGLANVTLAAYANAAANAPFVARGAASQSANLVEIQDSGGIPLSTFSENGYFTTRKTAAPADAELAAGEMALWFDATNGAAKLMVKAKQADGTVRTGNLALA